MRRGRNVIRLAAVLGALAVFTAGTTACEGLFGGVDGQAPVVHLADDKALLVEFPDPFAVAAYYCPQIMGAEACNYLCLAQLVTITCPLICPGFGEACNYLCPPMGLTDMCRYLNTPPPKEDLQFHFQLVFRIENPNQVPVPTTEILLGLHVFPDRTYGELASICTTLCEADAPDCPIPPSGACVYDVTDIDTIEEFLVAGVRGALFLAADLINGERLGEHLGLYTIPAGSDLDLKVRFSIGIDPMLELLRHSMDEFYEQAANTEPGGQIGFDIPYALAGRIWFNVPYLGRITVGFGPFGDAQQPLLWTVF